MKLDTPLHLPPSSRAPERLALVAILIIFIVAGVVYSVSTPFLDISDEVRHYAMIEHLAQGNGLPVQNPAQHGFYEQEGSQPPLYYALMALVALPFDRNDFMQLAQFNPHARLGRADTTSNWNQLIHTAAEQFPWRGTVLVVHLLRFLGILMGAVTVACTYLLAQALVSDEGRKTKVQYGSSFIPILAAAFTAFNPMFVFISASVNNDNLAAMLSSLALLLGVRMVRHGLNWRNATTLGVMLGCAAIAKASALALVIVIPPAIALSQWLRWRRTQADNRVSLAQSVRHLITWSPPLLVTLALVAVIAGWWYMRNAILYNGDFTGTSMMATIAGAREILPSVWEIIGEWDGFRKAYWGLFGAVNIPMDLWIYSAFDVILIVAAIGLVLLARDAVRSLRPPSPTPVYAPARRVDNTLTPPSPRGRASSVPTSSPLSPWERVEARGIAALMCLGVFLVAFAALIRWTSITLASQGRLLFPVIAVISTFIAWGLWRSAYVLRFMLYALLPALAILTLLCPFLYIRPAYATPPRLRDETQLPQDMIRTELRFEDAIRWIGYRVETERVQPGQEFIVTLYWQGLRPIDTNYSAGIRLFGRGDTELYLLDTYPGGGMWQTTRWQPGEIIADRYRLRVEDTITATSVLPTALRLDVGYWDFQTKQFLQTFDGSGNPTGRQRYEVGALAVPGNATAAGETASVPHLVQAKPAQVQTVKEGNLLTMTITWEVTEDFREDYTVFAHLFNSAGDKVAQADGRAANNEFSARWWRKGDHVADPHVFQLPADLPAGDYTIRYGLYRPTDGARMPAFDAQGQPISDAALSQPITIR